ncbi:MAG: hypothetical protein Q7S58_20105 [Candidatus Binatus sp.]|uniref:hypothetical protein n=1 Tax=Candidatus Binatus sp. TaxID=2811406 RepID=UPI002721AE17|nr:hypothetical protein [Candidatus Binatus sp.]MDO8434707.1 hypothetical protein [Candidatus Binatus sp.]
MTAKPSTTLAAAAIVIAILGSALSANAIEVKKKLMMPGPSDSSGGPASGPPPANPMNAGQRQALQDAVASDSEQSLAEESEKKSSGQNYVDLDHAKFSYMPTSSTVTAKLSAPECKGKKGGASSCTKTGTEKTLVFKYKIDGNKLAQADPPKWEEAAADTKEAKKK